MRICNALSHHRSSAFSLSILEFLKIINLLKEKSHKLILEREHYYLDTLKPIYIYKI